MNRYLFTFITLLILTGCISYKKGTDYNLAIVGDWRIYEEFIITEGDTIFIKGTIYGIAFNNENSGLYDDYQGNKTDFTYHLLTKEGIDFIVLSGKKVLEAKKFSYKYYSDENRETLELYSNREKRGYILRRRKNKLSD